MISSSESRRTTMTARISSSRDERESGRIGTAGCTRSASLRKTKEATSAARKTSSNCFEKTARRDRTSESRSNFLARSCFHITMRADRDSPIPTARPATAPARPFRANEDVDAGENRYRRSLRRRMAQVHRPRQPDGELYVYVGLWDAVSETAGSETHG